VNLLRRILATATVMLCVVDFAYAENSTCEFAAELVHGPATPIRVSAKNGELTFQDHAGNASKRRITVEDFAVFRSTLDEIDIWEWNASYAIPHSPAGSLRYDGSTWSISVRCGSASISTHGVEAYPGDSDPKVASPVATPRFRKLQSAIEKLGGGAYIFM